MNVMSKFISITLFLLFIFVSIHSSQQNVEWRGTIEEVDGVTVVKNPKEPMYREDVLRLDEELSIFKTRGGDEPKFRMVKSIAVDDFGNIYILDIPKIHVAVFDKNGAFLKTIGEEEKELGATEIISLKQNQIVIRNLKKRKLKYYTLNGEFIKTLSIDKENFGFSQMAIDTQGNIYSSISFEDKENAKLELYKFDSNLNYLFSLGYSMRLEQRVFMPFNPTITWAITKKDSIVFGKPDEYLIKIFSPKGTLIKKITREYEPITIPKAEKDRWKKKEGEDIKYQFRNTTLPMSIL